MNERIAVVLAAGKGTRMKTDLPKVLYPVLGRPMIEYVLDALDKSGVDRILVVVGYKSELVREQLVGRSNVTVVEQTEQLGTGHAVMVCREQLAGQTGPCLIVTGDCPMIRSESVRAMYDHYEKSPIACILGTAYNETPFGLGRIVRNEAGDFIGIVEEKDATDEQRKITEINMSYYLFRTPDLLKTLDHLRTDNAQGEYYITDAPSIMLAAGDRIEALPILKPSEALGINTIDDVAVVERELNAS
jgi:UDP-N-acetylglucosamine diphosphorylase/glucosamine-1-phosphate N-acetyltransferase